LLAHPGHLFQLSHRAGLPGEPKGNQATGRPAALTVAVLRPELFRIVVQTAEVPLPDEAGGVPGAWARTTEGWDS
jgi:hypothetical protein